jgi:hypothetical protein
MQGKTVSIHPHVKYTIINCLFSFQLVLIHPAMVYQSIFITAELFSFLTTRQSFCILTENNALMKQYSYLWLCMLAMAVTLSSCEVVGGIFKAGFWSAIIIVIVVVALIIWLVGRGRR